MDKPRLHLRLWLDAESHTEGKEGGRNKARRGKNEVGGEEKQLTKSSAKALFFFFFKET